jgi:hypothetical protein
VKSGPPSHGGKYDHSFPFSMLILQVLLYRTPSTSFGNYRQLPPPEGLLQCPRQIEATGIPTSRPQGRPLRLRFVPIRNPPLPAHHCRTSSLGRCSWSKWRCTRSSSRRWVIGCSHRVREDGRTGIDHRRVRWRVESGDLENLSCQIL